MRLLIAANHANLVGGIETYLRDVILALRQRGHALAIVTSIAVDPAAPPLHPADAQVPTWSFATSGIESVLKHAGDWRPDVAFVHGLESVADEQAIVGRFPSVFMAHGHAATCISGRRAHAFPDFRPCHRQFGPACLVYYLPRRCGGLNPLSMVRLYHQASQRRKLLASYRGVVVASNSMADEYREHGVLADRLHLIPLFPTGPSFTVTPTDRSATGRLLFVGRLYPEKGTRVVIDAVRGASDRLRRPLTLVVAGEGPERQRMERDAAKLGVPTEFHGWVTPERRAELMLGVDLLVVPSVCPETFGLVGVEAGCLGLPAVAFAVGGIPDWVIPGRSGELAPGDPPRAAELAAAIARALADPGHLRKLSAGALETSRGFSLERHVVAVETLLQQVAIAARS